MIIRDSWPYLWTRTFKLCIYLLVFLLSQCPLIDASGKESTKHGIYFLVKQSQKQQQLCTKFFLYLVQGGLHCNIGHIFMNKFHRCEEKTNLLISNRSLITLALLSRNRLLYFLAFSVNSRTVEVTVLKGSRAFGKYCNVITKKSEFRRSFGW